MNFPHESDRFFFLLFCWGFFKVRIISGMQLYGLPSLPMILCLSTFQTIRMAGRQIRRLRLGLGLGLGSEFPSISEPHKDWWIAVSPILASVLPFQCEITKLITEASAPTEIYTKYLSPGPKQKKTEEKTKDEEKTAWRERKKTLIQLLEQANSSSTSKLLKLSLLMLSERHHLRVAQNTGRVEEKES